MNVVTFYFPQLFLDLSMYNENLMVWPKDLLAKNCNVASISGIIALGDYNNWPTIEWSIINFSKQLGLALEAT